MNILRSGLTVFLLVLFLLAAGMVFGQVVTGTILGVVSDTTGAAVSGATVEIKNLDTGFSRSEMTDREGRYRSQNLPLGSYSVTVQQPGFRTAERLGISLSVASEVAINVQLALGDVQEKVEVTADAPAIETTNAAVSTLVTAEQIRDLPLNGRSVDQLALLTPGLSLDHTGGFNPTLGMGTRLSINGSRTDAILYLLDGTAVNDQGGGGPGSADHNMLGVEGVLEFRFLSHSFSAEYGKDSGGVLSQVTRSGTNDFHGSLYEFLRNNVFDARNFFSAGSLPPLRRNQFGVAAGGPIIKNRLFFFANYEGLRQRQGMPINIAVPDANARQGLLPCSAAPTSTCNAATNLAQVPVNQGALPFVNLYPLPNGPSNGDGTAQYRGTFNSQATENYGMGRLDYRISDKDNFYLRDVSNPSYLLEPRGTPTLFATQANGLAQFALLAETHIFSPTTLNDFRVAYNRTFSGSGPDPLQPIPASITMVPGQRIGRIVFANVIGGGAQLPELGFDNGDPQSYPQNLFEETEMFSTIRGAHSLKFGADVERIDINPFFSPGMEAGRVQFGSLAAFLAGTPSTATVVVPGTPNCCVFSRGWRRTFVGWFAQDEFRIRPNLTLTLGLRQDIFTTPSEVNGFSGAMIHVTDSKPTVGPPFISDKNTLAPRLGLAWDPTGSGKMSVRAGAGLYYTPLDGRNYYGNAGANPLFLNSLTINNPPFPNILANGVSSVLPSTTSDEYHEKNALMISYSMEVQRQLTSSLSLRVGYVGSNSDHLSRVYSANIKIPTILSDGSQFFPATGAVSVNPLFNTIQYIATDGRANYNGLQATLQKNLSHGLQFQASYTWSKAMSDADFALAAQSTATPGGPLDPNNLRRDWSPSVYDQRQALVWTTNYNLPFDKALKGSAARRILGGWAINEIYTYGSGLPETLLDSFNNSRDGDSSNTPDRPSLNSGFSQNPISGVTAGCQGIPAGQALGTVARWYDPCAFSLSPAGTFGNLGRNTVTQPGINNIDLALSKTTSLTERMKLQFRWEAFNAFNHPAFYLPSNAVFNSSRAYNGGAGLITSTIRDNRDMQLGLKLVF